jgi:uncharacterized protein (TIGR03435 family)
MAYDIPHPGRELIGLRDWGSSRVYDIEATAPPDFPVLPPDENEAQIKLMMREMLADRFKLRLHTETREESVLIMTAEKDNLKIKEAAVPAAGEKKNAIGAAMSGH